MITIFNREEVCCTFSIDRKVEVTELLEKYGILYKVKVRSRDNNGGARRRSGTFGESMKMMYEYIIYVHRNDYEKAKGILRISTIR